MNKAVIKKRTAALAMGGAMSLSCLAGAVAMALTGERKVALAAGNIVNVDASMQYQTFDGWGTSLAWWANECGDWTREHSSGKTQRDYIMELLFSEEGLNWNIARYNVGGGENPEHSHLSFDTDMPGFQPNGRGTAYDWENGDGTVKDWDETADARQLWVLNSFQEIRKKVAEKNGKDASDAITEFFSNSPPYWMLNNQCASGSGKLPNLKNDYIDDYVNYFVDVYKYLIDQGFTVDLLQPFNESATIGEGWGSVAGNTGSQEGCAFSPQQKVQVINGVMKRVNELAEEDPKYAAGYNLGDEVDTGRANTELDKIAKISGGKEVVTGADKLTYHIYGYQIDQAQQLYRRAKENGQKAEMSEITWTVSDVYDPGLMATALNKYSQSIIDIVKYGAAESYVYWQGMENLTGLIKTGWNYGVLHGVYDNPEMPSTVSGIDLASRGLVYQDVRTCKTYYVAGQYSKYIQAGYHIVEIDDDRSLAAISPEGDKLVIVKENNGANSTALNFNLSNFEASKITKIYTDAAHDWAKEEITGDTDVFHDTVTPYSVTTYVIEGASKAGSAHIIDESARVSKTNFTAMQTEIGNNQEKEALYTAGSWSDGGQNNTGSFAGRTVYNSGIGDRYVAVRFYGTGVGVLAERKSDSAVLQYWCDPELTGSALPETPTGEVDTTNATRLYKQQVLRVNNLEKGWHTVYLKVKSGYLNLDGVFVIDGADDAAVSKPVITGAFGKDKTLYVEFKEVAGATAYSVEYRRKGGSDWTTASGTLAANTLNKITDSGFTAGDYEVVVKATKSEGTVSSGICTVKMSMAPDGLLYYVDCATSNFNDGGWGRVYGSCQSTFDKDYGADPVTGINWGVDTANTNADKGWRDEDPFSSIYYGGDKKVTYKFTVPVAGSYVLAVGGFRPEGWGNRDFTITIDTGALTKPKGTLTSKDSASSIVAIPFTTSTANKEITVSIPKPDGLSLMAITESGKPIPIMAEGKSNYTMNGTYDHSGVTQNGEKYIGTDLTADDANASFNLIMSDGSKKAFSASDGGLTIASKELSKMSAGEYYTVGYTLGGSNWKEGWPDMTVYAAYLLTVQKKITQNHEVIVPEKLYYFIDSGSYGYYNGSDKVFNPGQLQNGTNPDQKYDGSNGWGFVDSRSGEDGCNWKDDKPESSIRELSSGSGYVMTGFTANQRFTLEVGMNCQSWSNRTADVYVGGTYANNKITGGSKVGTIEMVQNGGVKVGRYEVTADADGNLVVSFIKTKGDNPQIAYIKAFIPAVEQEEVSSALPTLPAIKVGQTAYFRQGFEAGSEPSIELKGLEIGARVYVIDSNDNLVDSFAATAASYSWKAWDKVAEDAYGLRFTQAKKETDATSASGSPETVVALPRINVTCDNKTVKIGDKVAIVIAPTLGKVPKEVFGSIDSLKVTRPDGVTADVIGSFFYRTIKNGVHTVTAVCNGVEFKISIDVEGIETLDMKAEYGNNNGWTSENVTIKLTPESSAGVKEMFVIKGDGEFGEESKVELSNGSYTITASENGVYKVKVVTNTGTEKIYTYEVNNIVKADEEVTLSLSVNYGTSGGVQFKYKGTGTNGALYVKKDGGEAVKVASLDTFTATQAGKYEFYYENAVGKTSETHTYYVTDEKTEANFGTVSVGEDGTVTVTGKDGSAVTAKLYRAGDNTALSDLNVAKDGKYYLEITNAEGMKEVVVINTAEGSAADNVTVVQPPVPPSKGGVGSTDLILTIVFAVLAAAAVAGIVVIVIKRRRVS